MCTFALVAAVGSAAFQAYGAMQQSQATKAAYNYQAKVNQRNEQLAEYQAQDALNRGQAQEDAVRRRTAQLKGTQTASLAARGLDISEGSALNILSDTDYMGEQDALTTRDNAKRQAWAYREQGKGYGADANALQARADAENPLLAAGGSLLSNAGTVADRWYSYKKSSDAGTASFWS